ncbi:hypothetical protein [Leptolyngbya ohadii]|uniref:hypothetical protein n=1 Tax=Leptolyngbya ohadii TaxID=1962290 RepID=UPI000B59DD0C|nr:hypothetical protein [Leptolyngbya ohadii]
MLGFSSVDRVALSGLLGGLTIALSSFPGLATDRSTLEQNGQFRESVGQMAQSGDTTCRQTNAVTAIYQQPDTLSVSQGVLPPGRTVRLEVVGTGTGWSRIREPIVGWVEARYLTPPTPCPYSTLPQSNRPLRAAAADRSSQGSNPAPAIPVAQSSPALPSLPLAPSQPIASRAPIMTAAPSSFPSPNLPPRRSQVTVPPLPAVPFQPSPQFQPFPQPVPLQNLASRNSLAARPTVPPIPAIVAPRPVQTERTIVTVTCDVLPTEGLIVRQQPNLDSPGSAVLAPGTYNFRFTGATETIGRRRLAYIVVPAQGWIQVLTQDRSSTLGGDRCG